MDEILQNIFEGAVYLLTLILIITSIFFLVMAAVESLHSNYWSSIAAVIESAFCFGIVFLTSKFIRKPQ